MTVLFQEDHLLPDLDLTRRGQKSAVEGGKGIGFFPTASSICASAR